MPTLDELQAHIIANTTGFVAGGSTGGTPLWLGEFPSSTAYPDTAVTIYDTGGVPPIATLNNTTPFIRQPGVQVLSRSTSYTTARDNASRIWDLFFATINTAYPTSPSSTSTVSYLTNTPSQDLIDMGTDQNHRHLVSANYTIKKESA